MNLRLIHFEATDRLGLAGLLYEPRKKTRDIVIFLHGNGDSSVFYSGRSNALGEILTRAGIAYMPFNNRGAYMVKRLRRRVGRKPESLLYGMSRELIRECVPDIEGAIRYARSSGYSRVHLVGHSTGANKICVYNAYRPRNAATSYLLLAGGDDSGLYRRQWGDAAFDRRLDVCRERIRRGRGEESVPRAWTPFIMTYRSLYDTINPNGDYNVFPFLEVMEHRISTRPLFRHFRSIRTKPAYVLYGSEDEFCFDDVPRCVDILRAYAPPRNRMKFGIVDGANHGFTGMEEQLGTEIVGWVKCSARPS